MKKVSTESYKGVRDFYPEDWRFQKWLFWKMTEVVEKFGYENYTASPLEYTSLFEAKSGREIVEKETYNLVDRGGRDVTLRPEMTPTISRMIAAKNREIPRPIRWYSIPNVFRYEKPQRGRLREHYQLNVDFFGINGVEAEIEMIEIGAEIMKNIGAKNKDFEIRLNDRGIWESIFTFLELDENQSYEISKLVDKKKKLEKDIFEEEIKKQIGEEKSKNILEILEIVELKDFKRYGVDEKVIDNLEKIKFILENKNIKNVIFDITLMRGFDYYTGVVFEFFDTHPDNNRSLFGGGRYDNLLDIFGQEKIPAIGFGMGDVTARDFLEVRNILPKEKIKTDLSVLLLDKKLFLEADKIVSELRENGLKVEFDFSYRKLEKEIKSAEKKGIENILVLGENEIREKRFILKNIFSGDEKKDLSLEDIFNSILK